MTVLKRGQLCHQRTLQLKYFLPKRTEITVVDRSVFSDEFESDNVHNNFQVVLRRDSEKALRMKDDMMAPPRCKGKAEELGLTEQTDWKDYFARDEPFYETD